MSFIDPSPSSPSPCPCQRRPAAHRSAQPSQTKQEHKSPTEFKELSKPSFAGAARLRRGRRFRRALATSAGVGRTASLVRRGLAAQIQRLEPDRQSHKWAESRLGRTAGTGRLAGVQARACRRGRPPGTDVAPAVLVLICPPHKVYNELSLQEVSNVKPSEALEVHRVELRDLILRSGGEHPRVYGSALNAPIPRRVILIY